MPGRNVPILLISLMAMLLMSGDPASAHSPVGSKSNESLEMATHVHEPTKSWAIYSELHTGGKANYFKMEMKEGMRIVLNLFVPKDDGFLPGLVLMGPGLVSNGTVPSFIEVPHGDGAIVFSPRLKAPEYEPFTPASNYMLVDVDMKAPVEETYYVAVFDADRGGKYGLAIGYVETFTPQEWLGIPLNLITIYKWEGQSMAEIMAPGIIVSLLSLILISLSRWKKGTRSQLYQWIGIMAGAAFLGSVARIGYQISYSLAKSPTGMASIWVTIMFAMLAAMVGVLILSTVLRPRRRKTILTRTYLIILGIFGLVFWAGFYIGPALAILAAMLPIEERGTMSKDGKKKGKRKGGAAKGL